MERENTKYEQFSDRGKIARNRALNEATFRFRNPFSKRELSEMHVNFSTLAEEK